LPSFELSDGSVVRLGVTNWLTPNKNLIKGEGIKWGCSICGCC
jgi:carboxyl-terminal processing protease